MRNLKHTIMAIFSVAMVGTLSFFQVSEDSAKPERRFNLATANKTESISIEEAAVEEKELEQAIAEKSSLTEGYAKVTGTAELKTSPSEDAESIGTMSGAEDLEVLESTEGWYKVMVDGEAGYVQKDLVTLDKSEAEMAAKQYDHYKKATVTSENGLLVRTSGSKEASCVGTVNGGDEVIIVDSQNDYIKILYGDELTEGYVINSGLEFEDEWVTKNEVHQEIKEIAYAKAVAARKAAEAAEAARRAENARLAAMGYSSKETSTKSASASATTSVAGRGQALVNSAKNFLGVPYVWGGTTPRGFDCSGLVQYVCRQNGISVPRVAASQRNVGTYVSRANLQPGDLVFFGNGGRITHVGIYVGNGNMIHAPQTGDVVKISSINSSYRVARYAGAVRVW